MAVKIKYIEKMKELNLEKDSIKKTEILDTISSIEEAQSQLQKAEDGGDQAAAAEITADIEQMDADLCKDLVRHASYQERSQKMAAGRAAKKGAQSPAAPSVAAAPDTTTPLPPAAPAAATASDTTPPGEEGQSSATNADGTNADADKKISVGSVVLGFLVVGALSILGIHMVRNNS